MKHVSHPSNTRTLGAPAGWNHDAVPCDALPITDMLAGGLPCVVSFWRPERAELEALIDGRPMALSIMGRTMPPVMLAVDVDQDAAPSASSGVLTLVQQRLDERDEYFGHHQRPEPSDEERRTLGVLRQAERELRRLSEGTAQSAEVMNLLAQIRALPMVRAHEIDGEESDGTPRLWRNRPYVSLTQLKRLLSSALPQPAPVQRDAWRGGSSYEASMLRNLLARVHGDGGHYVEQYGLEKALEDADLLVATWRATPAPQDVREPSEAAALAAVMLERRRQVDVEGWTPEHDDTHVNDEIAAMACFYAMPPGAREWPATETGYGHTLGAAIVPEGWEAKEGDRWRELVKAGALILAEAARVYRAERKAQNCGGPA